MARGCGAFRDQRRWRDPVATACMCTWQAVARPARGDWHSGKAEAYGDFIRELGRHDLGASPGTASRTRPIGRDRHGASLLSVARSRANNGRARDRAIKQDPMSGGSAGTRLTADRSGAGTASLRRRDVDRHQYYPQPGRCPKSGHSRTATAKTTTLLTGLRMTDVGAPMMLHGSIKGENFEAYVSPLLVPELRPLRHRHMVNLASHKRASVRGVDRGSRRDNALPAALTRSKLPFWRLKAMPRRAGEDIVSGSRDFDR